MHAAADRCQRIGACRKTGSGVMCPSYMATREEEHATRGRANALVKALSEPDPAAALGDERLHEILDLCLECKACKSECPLSVDMASLKAEFLVALQRDPRHAAALAPVRRRSGRSTGSAARRRRCRTCPCRAGLLGSSRDHQRRPRPRFERETLIRWDRKRARAAARAAGDLPRRLVHDVHRARRRPRLDRAARGGGLRRAARERRLLRARVRSPRACSTTRAPRPRR